MEGKRVDCTPAVIARRCNWRGTRDAKQDPVQDKLSVKWYHNVT
jgi:hypothetical protein